MDTYLRSPFIHRRASLSPSLLRPLPDGVRIPFISFVAGRHPSQEPRSCGVCPVSFLAQAFSPSSSSVSLTDTIHSCANVRLQIHRVRCSLLPPHPSCHMANRYAIITMPRASPPFHICRSPHSHVHYPSDTGKRELWNRTVHC